MSRSFLIAAAAVVAALGVWLLASGLALPARALVVLLVGFLPPLLLFQGALAEDDVAELRTGSIYLSSMAMIWVMGGAALWAGSASDITPERMGIVGIPLARGISWTAGVTAVALLVPTLGRALGWRETPLLERLLPRTPAQRTLFVGLALSAGVFEEIAFRGFLLPALHDAGAAPASALLISSGAFGLMHGYQSWRGALRAAALGALLAVPFMVTGSLLPSMAAHATYDLIVGLLLGDWLVRSKNDDH